MFLLIEVKRVNFADNRLILTVKSEVQRIENDESFFFDTKSKFQVTKSRF